MPERNAQQSSLGEVIRQHREAAGYSIRQLAGLVGVHHSYLARLEAGDNDRPAPSVLQQLADVLEIDAAELLSFIGLKPSLPAPRAYFRRAYGLNDEQAEEAERWIEQQFGKPATPQDKQEH